MTPVLDLLATRPRLLALGEPTHGEGDLLDVRNDLFRHLVEHEGYRTVAVETDCLKGLLVDDHVTSGAGTLDEVMRDGFSHGFGAFPANRELVRWMRAFNDGRPPHDRVRFAGFEPPPDTVEGVLYARPPADVVDPRTLGAVTRRESPWYGYAPLDPDHLPAIDAIVFVRDVEAGHHDRAGVEIERTSSRNGTRSPSTSR